MSKQSRPDTVQNELPMTMQVGMVGTDGIVLAGDMLCTREPVATSAPSRLGTAARCNYGSSKILIHDTERLP
jgi:hypothetical protein